MDFDALPASNYSMPELVGLLNRGFEEYFIPIQFNNATLGNMIRKDGIDLTISRVLTINGQPLGIALIARRGTPGASRLAAMGIAKEARGRGAGSWMMGELIRQAGQRGDLEMVLEVIEHNKPAVNLYRKWGFRTVRRLIGFVRRDAEESDRSQLHQVDLAAIARLVEHHGLVDLPWQLSGETISQLTSPARAYQAGQAYMVISDPDAEQIVIWSLLVEPGARGTGRGTAMLKTVIANHPGRTWHMPAILPEELGKVFERAGFEKEDLSQWQMKLGL